MSKEKQIEEMTDELSKVQTVGLVITESQMDSRNSYSREIKNKEVAEHLYNTGYCKSEWISVDERLPETSDKVLVYCSNGQIYPAKCIRVPGLEFWFEETCDHCCHSITHWMPLPEAPKMKGGVQE